MKRYVLDTNVLISNPNSIFAFTAPDTEIIITQATLGELDHLKSKQEISREVRMVIRSLGQIVLDRDIKEISETGIKLQPFCKTLPDTVTMRIVDYKGEEKFELNQQDARIIATAKQENATLITRDINMLLIALSSECPAEQYTGDNTLKDTDVLFKGYNYVPSDFWETLADTVTYDKTGKVARICTEDFPVGSELYPGTFIIQQHDNDEELIGQIVEVDGSDVFMKTLNNGQAKGRKVFGIKPRDVYQAASIEAILDGNNDVVSLIGGAGSGKSLMAIAAGLELVVEKKKFSKVIYVKADAGMGTDAHGYLPGDINEKLSQNILAAKDSLDALCAGAVDKEGAMEHLMERYMEFPSMYYFRGRTLGNAEPGGGAIIIVDEAQNLTVHEITSILSRAGENSKVILMGNVKQIDNRHVNALNNGMVYAVQKFRDYKHSSHVILSTVYRSRLAGFIEDNF